MSIQKCPGNGSTFRLSREICCKATPIMCLQGQVCLRALVYSPYGNFFLSGCHPEEDHLSGCDYHTLPHNSSVHRCVCKDSECQNSFPGDCPIKGITDLTVRTFITCWSGSLYPALSLNSLFPPSWSVFQKPLTTTLAPHSSTPPSLLARNRTRSNSARGRHHHNHSLTSSGSMTLFSIFVLSLWVATVTVIWYLVFSPAKLRFFDAIPSPATTMMTIPFSSHLHSALLF